MAEVVIRDAEPGDSAAVASLLTQLGAPGVDETEATRRLRRGHERILVGSVGGEVAGLCAVMRSLYLGHAEAVAHITAMVVDDRARRTGVGRALVEAAIAWAKASGCSGVELTTATSTPRQAAHAFYPALGFQRTSYRYWYELSGR